MSAAAYGAAVEFGRFDRADIAERLSLSAPEVDRVEHVLRLLHLLQPMPGDPDVLVPVGPDVAAADLVGSAEHQIRDLQQAVTDVRSKLLSLMPRYFEGRRMRNRLEAFDVISDKDTIQSMINHLTQQCRKELLTVQPGGARSSPSLASARQRALNTLDRGVRIRTIYQHTARSDLATRAYVRDISAEGAEVRTADELIDRMIIYDRETVFLPERKSTSKTPGAAIVREPTLVAFLCAVFEHLWDGATPFSPDSQSTSSGTDDLRASIIRLMAKGYKDEMVARRLGMSVRTCRRHISEITEQLEATSRFQAGFNVALSGMLDQFGLKD
ncbi:LuxR C-terminal-related transcriptional regulator [Streptomyces sp. NPDC006733]|uniref:LuxR C-terminal-related transcriptional regulator n=1 Tax=Streptomyces sp. NPDC006733 TaxID=3155460 RepID=UPI0033C8EB2D